MPKTTTVRARGVLVLAFAVAAAAALAGGTSEPSATDGTVVVLLTDHREAIADFSELLLQVARVALHDAGAPRDSGWVIAPQPAGKFDLAQLVDGQTAEVTRWQVPVGRYDAVRLGVAGAVGVVREGTPVAPAGELEIPVQLSPVAVTLDVRAGSLTVVTIDLVVTDISDHPGQTYDIQIRQVTRRLADRPG